MPSIAAKVEPARKLRIGIADCLRPQHSVTAKKAKDIIAHSKITPTVTDGKLVDTMDAPTHAPKIASQIEILKLTTCEIFLAIKVAHIGMKNSSDTRKWVRNGAFSPLIAETNKLSAANILWPSRLGYPPTIGSKNDPIAMQIIVQWGILITLKTAV